jgi:hypothetical protein
MTLNHRDQLQTHPRAPDEPTKQTLLKQPLSFSSLPQVNFPQYATPTSSKPFALVVTILQI